MIELLWIQLLIMFWFIKAKWTANAIWELKLKATQFLNLSVNAVLLFNFSLQLESDTLEFDRVTGGPVHEFFFSRRLKVMTSLFSNQG